MPPKPRHKTSKTNFHGINWQEFDNEAKRLYDEACTRCPSRDRVPMEWDVFKYKFDQAKDYWYDKARQKLGNK